MQFSLVQAQTPEQSPAKWNLEVVKDTISNDPNKVIFVFKGVIPAGHHVYSSDYECPNGGPLPSEVKFDSNASFSLDGKLKAIGAEEVFDDIFECNVKEFHDVAEFRQHVTYKSKSGTVTGEIGYQMCSPSGLCVLHTYKFKHTFTVLESVQKK